MYVDSISSQALYATYAIKTADTAVARASQRLSTGLRINNAADDPSGLAIANNFKKYISSYKISLNNINDGIAMNQIAEQGLNKIYDTLSNMYTLAVSSYTASTTAASSTSDQALMDANDVAFQKYITEINNLANAATYNGKTLLSSTNSYSIQADISSDSVNSITLNYSDSRSSALGVSGLDIGYDTADSFSGDDGILNTIQSAMNTINEYQVTVGAQANILTNRADFVSGQITNNTQAYGNIMNANMAEESANLASAGIKRDAATAMLAQANTMNADIVTYLLKAYGG